MSERLVSVKKYNPEIVELSILKRIEINHPMLVRESVAKKLANVAKNLPNDLQLQIDSGYRSRSSQESIWQTRFGQFGHNYKNTRNLVFDPEKGIPPHTTGGAVDVSLIERSTHSEINLSEPFSKFYTEPQLRSNKISERAQELRLLLNKLMLKEKFAPNKTEYWHFSYGDEMWANFYHLDTMYDEVKSEKAERFSHLNVVLFKILKRGYRLKNRLFGVETNF